MNTTTRPRAARRAIVAALASAMMMIPCTTVSAAETGVPLDAAHFPDKTFRSVVQQYDTNNNGTLSQQELTAATTINVGARGIKSAKGIEYFTALTSLDLSNNQLSSVDVSHNTALEWLYLDGNQLSSVDVSHNTKLDWLFLSYNQLSSVDLSHNTELDLLNLSDNQLSSVDLSHNTKLTELSLGNNQLSSVDLSHNTALTFLYLDYNQLSSVDLSHNTELLTLYLDYNQLSSMDLSHNTELVSLYLDGNQLSSVDVSHNTALTYLEITDNPLSSMDLSHNTKLDWLDLSNNQLSSLDVSHNTALEDLYLNGNQLSSMDLSHNTALEDLGLSGNRLLWVGGVANSINLDLSDQQEFGPAAASSLDLAKAAPGIDVSRISNVQGGKLQGTVLTPTNAGGLVTYDYRFSDAYEPLHAQVRFGVPSFTVAFDTNGGYGNSVVSVVSGKKATEPAAPTRTGYTFNGWYTAKDGGSKYDFSKPVTGNLTLYAHWTANTPAKITFRDVSASTPHVDDIRWLADRGISTGWKEADGSFTFRGMSPVVRQDMAAFLRREARNRGVADAASWQPSAADWKRFRDVDRNTPHAEDILWLAHAGISEGWKEADGSFTFRGMSPVVRQDMAAFLKRLAAKAGKDGGVSPKTDFTDVTAATPHVADIQWLGGSGISQGYRNNDGSWRFEGMTSVYRQDMAAFIHRLDTRISK